MILGAEECWYIFEEDSGNCQRSFGQNQNGTNRFEDCQAKCLEDPDCMYFDFDSQANEGSRFAIHS